MIFISTSRFAAPETENLHRRAKEELGGELELIDSSSRSHANLSPQLILLVQFLPCYAPRVSKFQTSRILFGSYRGEERERIQQTEKILAEVGSSSLSPSLEVPLALITVDDADRRGEI